MTTFKPLSFGFFVVALLAGASGAARAQAETPPAQPAPARSSGAPFSVSSGPFGDTGQLVFSMASEGEFPFRFTKTKGSDWNLAFRPALDYFIQQSVSVGALVRIETGGGGSTVGLGLRAGLNVPLGGVVSLWVRGGLEFDHFGSNDPNNSGHSVTTLGVGAPFLFHLVPHFFMGVGPFFALPLTNSEAMGSKDPTFGLTAIVGGYF
jgi:hypothetical protein